MICTCILVVGLIHKYKMVISCYTDSLFNMNFFEPSEEDDKLGSTVQPLVFSNFFFI